METWDEWVGLEELYFRGEQCIYLAIYICKIEHVWGRDAQKKRKGGHKERVGQRDRDRVINRELKLMGSVFMKTWRLMLSPKHLFLSFAKSERTQEANDTVSFDRITTSHHTQALISCNPHPDSLYPSRPPSPVGFLSSRPASCRKLNKEAGWLFIYLDHFFFLHGTGTQLSARR